jgi:hypothetical protein
LVSVGPNSAQSPTFGAGATVTAPGTGVNGAADARRGFDPGHRVAAVTIGHDDEHLGGHDQHDRAERGPLRTVHVAA